MTLNPTEKKTDRDSFLKISMPRSRSLAFSSSLPLSFACAPEECSKQANILQGRSRLLNEFHYTRTVNIPTAARRFISSTFRYHSLYAF